MICPNKPLKITDTKQLDRMFLRFIDKNGIQIECIGDVHMAVKLFVKAVDDYLNFNSGWER